MSNDDLERLELPPLPPEVDWVAVIVRGEKDSAEPLDYYYTQEQMRIYARTAILADRQRVDTANTSAGCVRKAAEIEHGGARAAEPVAIHQVRYLTRPAGECEAWYDIPQSKRAELMACADRLMEIESEPFYEFRTLHARPAPAEVTDAMRLLSAEDMRWLRRFQDICEDSGADGHDVPKNAMRRLEKIGVVRSCGFGRHETTAFGDYILEAALGGGE